VSDDDSPGGAARPPAARRRSRKDLRAQLEATRAQLEATNARLEARAGRNLFLAVAIGLAFGALMLASLLWFVEFFAVVAAVLAVAASVEFTLALRGSGRRVPIVGSAIVGVAVVAASYLYGSHGLWWGTLASIAFLVLWRLLDEAIRRPRTGRLGWDLVTSVFVVLYVPLLAGFTVLLALRDGGEGRWWVVGFLIIVVAADVGAYAAGVLFGRHKMAPRISPGKTWEGFAGAVVACVTAGVLIALFLLHIPWWAGAIVGVVILLTATMGDLIESLIKRDLGIKDMSNWIPGHGGLLDRLDSALPSAAAAFGLYVLLAG